MTFTASREETWARTRGSIKGSIKGSDKGSDKVGVVVKKKKKCAQTCLWHNSTATARVRFVLDKEN